MTQLRRGAVAAASLVATLFVCVELSFRSPAHLGEHNFNKVAGKTASRRLSSNATDTLVGSPPPFRNTSVQPGKATLLAVGSGHCGRVEESVDYQGDDLEVRYGIFSSTACADECRALPACMSYTFARAQAACYLKGAQPKRVQSNCCVSGLRPCGVPPTPAPRKVDNHSGVGAGLCGRVWEGVDYQGDDLEMRHGIFSATACAGECWAEPACKSYTFAKAQGACYLKGAQPERVQSNCCVSGLRPCEAPPTPPPRKVYNYSAESLRGVAYAPLPCLGSCGVSEDMLQEGYQALWGPAPGRDDLRVIKDLGANTVRLYHSIGLDGPGNHGLFLDRAETLGLDVMPGYHTYNAIYGGCPDFDCYHTWKNYTLKAFKQGFRRQNSWHPAVSVLLLFNELDFFRAHGPMAHARSAVSALDGVLSAEREAGVEPGRVKLSIAWSNAPGTSLDGKVSGFAIWAFQDMVSAIANPAMLQYSPRTPQALMEEAFQTRWAHSINVQTPGILGYMAQHYHRFEPTPWFIGEYGANGLPQDAIQTELKSMEKSAHDRHDPFMGMAFFQFQTAYFKGGSEMNFGLFRLGRKKIGETGEVCDKGIGCKRFPVHCLTTDRGSHPEFVEGRAEAVEVVLPEFVQGRAESVAAEWGGMVNLSRMC